MRTRAGRLRTRAAICVAAAVALAVPVGSSQPASAGSRASAPGGRGGNSGVAHFSGLTAAQRHQLMGIARDTWSFYRADVDPATALPLDNLTYAGGAKAPTAYGRYTSAANIGVYLWAVVSAEDLELVSRNEAEQRVRATLRTVSTMSRFHGFLHQWYDTSTAQPILNPGDAACDPEAAHAFDNCSFVSNVDNGLYASGLVVARQAMPALRPTIDALIRPMDFGLFYDARAETHCNVNPAVEGSQPTGQMFGGYYEGLPPTEGENWTHYYHNGALYSDPRISAYIGMGLHQMPGNVWWKSWRELPPRAPFADCTGDPDFSWQGQWPMAGAWKTVTDPQSQQRFTVWEGHYTYPGTNLDFIPTYGGGMFEGLMDNTVVPETSWGPRSLGRADVRTAKVQIRYATGQLHLPVWGMSPSSTRRRLRWVPAATACPASSSPITGRARRRAAPTCGWPSATTAARRTRSPRTRRSSRSTSRRSRRSPTSRTCVRLYPDVYGVGGFFDAVNPTTGAVGHRYLALDQSMIMASLDNALNDRALQRHFAADPVSAAARTYLGADDMFVG